MSAYTFVSVAGGSLGLLAGGLLTEALSWHWIFFVNLPIGVLAFVLGWIVLPRDRGLGLSRDVDILGSVMVTLAAMVAIYAIVGAEQYGLGSLRTLGLLGTGGGALPPLPPPPEPPPHPPPPPPTTPPRRPPGRGG